MLWTMLGGTDTFTYPHISVITLNTHISLHCKENRLINRHLFNTLCFMHILIVTTVSVLYVYFYHIGDMSWVMRIQNQSHYLTSPLDFPLTDITTLFMPSLSSRKEQQFEDFVCGHTRINSENLAESEYDVCISCRHVFEITVKVLC